MRVQADCPVEQKRVFGERPVHVLKVSSEKSELVKWSRMSLFSRDRT